MEKLGNLQWIELNEDGTFNLVEQIRKSLGSADEFLLKMASDLPVTIKGIAQPIAGGPIISVALKGGVYHAWGILDRIVLNCGWRSREGVLTPLFVHDNSPITMSLPWIPHPTMRIYFLEVMDKPNANFRRVNSYLIVGSSNPTIKGWMQLPLANTYDEGKLCLGREVPQTSTSISGMWASSYNHFCLSRFNSDLAYEHIVNGSEHLFKFKADTNSQVPVPEDWHRHCRRVNHSAYSIIQ